MLRLGLVVRKRGGTTEGSADFSEAVKRFVDANNEDVFTGGYAEIQFHSRVNLGQVESIELIRADPATGKAAGIKNPKMVHPTVFAKMSLSEQADVLEAQAREQLEAAAQIRQKLDEMGFPDVQVRTGLLNRELVSQHKNPDYIPGTRGTLSAAKEYIEEYADKIVYDTSDAIAEEQIGLLESLRKAHLEGTPIEGNFTRAHEISDSAKGPSLDDIRASIASAEEAVMEAENLTKKSTKSTSMAKRTLNGILDSGEVAARVMRRVIKSRL